jgi:hypothetical protein
VCWPSRARPHFASTCFPLSGATPLLSESWDVHVVCAQVAATGMSSISRCYLEVEPYVRHLPTCRYTTFGTESGCVTSGLQQLTLLLSGKLCIGASLFGVLPEPDLTAASAGRSASLLRSSRRRSPLPQYTKDKAGPMKMAKTLRVITRRKVPQQTANSASRASERPWLQKELAIDLPYPPACLVFSRY